jgi:hypothetical protein
MLGKSTARREYVTVRTGCWRSRKFVLFCSKLRAVRFQDGRRPDVEGERFTRISGRRETVTSRECGRPV